MNINDMIQESKIMTGPFPDFDKRSYENPLLHFKEWFKDAINSEVKEPTSVVVSTYDKEQIIDSRVMIIKAMDDQGFFIETNKERAKVGQIAYNQHVAINIYWREQGRQIRIQGIADSTANFDHVEDYLDAKTRDLMVYKIIPSRVEFYQAKNQGGYERLLYTLKENQWQNKWL